MDIDQLVAKVRGSSVPPTDEIRIILSAMDAIVKENLAEYRSQQNGQQPTAVATIAAESAAPTIISELGKLIVRYHGVQLGGIRELREELTRMRRELEHQHVPLKPPPGVYPATGPVPDLEEKEPKGLFGQFWDWLWAA